VTVGAAPRRRARRGSGALGWVVRLAVAVVVFAVGVAVGQALEDRPAAGEPITTFATIEPWTQTEPRMQTRTVTVTTP
jgi:hypothetical protein